MSFPQPPQKPQTLLGQLTQAVNTIQARVDFSKLALKPNAKVPELWVQDAGADKAEIYPLLGDRYILGRSSKSSDIVVRNPVVSQIHLSLSRDSSQRTPIFTIKDENSTNGIYLGKRRVTSLELRHGDVFTLGPPELAASVRLQYIDPPAWYIKAATWGFYGVGSVSALLALGIGFEWTKFSVKPLPTATQAPVIVYARDGSTPLREPRNIAHVDLKQLSEFGPYLPAAVVASEDSRYYWHFGVDPLGILRAVLINSRTGDVQQGASTVTQQTARSLFRDYVGRQDSLGRKVREAIVSLKLETFYSKDEILLSYLNRVFLGGDTSGFEDAAKYYFEKSAKELTLSEAATLVGILPAPNAFDFCGDGPKKLGAADYRNRVIKRMLEMGKISSEEANRARRSTVQVSPKVCERQAQTIAPYFYNYVFQELESILGEGAAREGNYIIETQLDPAIQAQAESALRNSVSNAGSSFRFSQGGMVTLDSRSGSILAMVGGVDYRTSQFNRATQAKRQPGSTFKIFAYTAALEQGISSSRSYSCASFPWQGFTYKPCRSGGGGSLDIATGLALSENPIALRVAREVGLNKVVDMAKRLGVQSSLDPVPGLVLGQSVVNVLEMTGAFGAISNRGVWNPPHAISRILDSSDCEDRQDLKTCRVIYSFDQDPDGNRQVLKPGVADEMVRLMRGVITRGTGRSASLGLGEGGKTGTTDKNVDLWFIGFIPSRQLVTGIWLGNDNNSPTSGSSAQAAQLWGNYMGRITK
ncbi:transglycosylase domain-containing protein [Anabaena cylindrica FACHB-243]|uniref:FHA modulated glycosyl transferase/transpeptidase n=1 Tax=Anabaena cylindrica (strain ATCC 27899 / PCC 7122) TaxID=272123 RepID=K9ZNJ8_ANACC|nr:MULTISPECIES: transglycosylase domain-containing protein [Anabaena]AFZ60803.1 FHA modulated glycosyl transferase/transpeptidase [Anabaena cylindrica PCC 7122]MBD2417103.1 transglycosylase domain-containing protein [Anabaena cylindrica FACHB-243]MBY5280799.1 FHA domain-containing protein [Anabaena sp. CCAP 1446/1C]MBY5307075.1 FHA domain-containing protein [Anabaena sp. CCAP 1446/1C]MCM2406804.1 transglycosylase domain-containing protein [Anabaena sp. CCAP 1446/1C]